MNTYSVTVIFEVDTAEEANTVACDIEQALSGRDLTDYFTEGDDYAIVRFPHRVMVSTVIEER